MNCLQYALYFNAKNPNYKIYYNGDHVINLDRDEPISGYTPIENYGLNNILDSFADTLYTIDVVRLKKYFEKAQKR